MIKEKIKQRSIQFMRCAFNEEPWYCGIRFVISIIIFQFEHSRDFEAFTVDNMSYIASKRQVISLSASLFWRPDVPLVEILP